jgi:5-methylthioadenosine/S-adenosylhomocysteine deaminase
MLTINAAKALGKENQLGSIEAGKLADLTAIRLNSLQTTPMYDVVSHLIYAASSQQVSHLWVGGRMLLKDEQFLHMDIDDIMDRANYWAKRIATETGAGHSKEYKIHD